MSELSTIQIRQSKITARGHWTAESPIWDGKRKVFFYIDIEGGTLHKFNPKNDETLTWQLGTKGDGDKNGHRIGGIALNSDGSLIVLLEGGINAGVNYFHPESGELLHVPDSWPEKNKEHNVPNDSTVVNINGHNRLLFGTMSKKWRNSPTPEGAFYVLDENLRPQKLDIAPPYPGTIIGNGLADGGINPDGTVNLFFAESVGDNARRNIFKGKLDPATYKVREVEIFADHRAITDGREGGPDGANMIMVGGKPAYAVAALETGEIRAYNPKSGKEVARIKLPDDMTNVTKFAIGEDGEGTPAMFVTSYNMEYGQNKGKDGVNGSTAILPLPPQIALHPASVQITDYPPMEELKRKIGASLRPGVQTPGLSR